MSDIGGEPDVDAFAERRGTAGFLILNRPKALNALTLDMVRIFTRGLDAFERDPSIARIVVMSSSGRAFCAGGDIRKLYHEGRAGDHAAQMAMWREEYRLNARLARCAKPVIALADGIVMGGGMGLSMHGSHCIVSERTIFAMPEVGIGFFPDVGATSRLSRLPDFIGCWLTLTAEQMGAGDLIRLNLAQAFVNSADFPKLAKALEAEDRLGSIIAPFQQQPPAPQLDGASEILRACFGAESVAEIFAALRQRSEPFAIAAANSMQAKSPTSQAIALQQMKLGATLSLEQALQIEYRIVTRIARGHDFYEGVRAVLIDRDKNPHWLPQRSEEVSSADIDAYFAQLEQDELSFDAGAT